MLTRTNIFKILVIDGLNSHSELLNCFKTAETA